MIGPLSVSRRPSLFLPRSFPSDRFPSHRRLCRESFRISGEDRSKSRSNLTRAGARQDRCVASRRIAPCHGGGNFSVSSSSTFHDDRLCLEDPSTAAVAARELPLLSSRSFIFVLAETKSAGKQKNSRTSRPLASNYYLDVTGKVTALKYTGGSAAALVRIDAGKIRPNSKSLFARRKFASKVIIRRNWPTFNVTYFSNRRGSFSTPRLRR